MKKSYVLPAAVLVFILLAGTTVFSAVSPWDGKNTLNPTIPIRINNPRSTQSSSADLGDVTNISTALNKTGDYLKQMQADITEDNAGNGNPDSPDDPDDGGWDWSVISPPAPFYHTTAASPQNTYGVTALGLYYAYQKNNSTALFTGMTDAANIMIADTAIRSASDLIFLMLYNDLPSVSWSGYKDSAKSKFDKRITKYGSATAFAQGVRDTRGISQGYPNGIIAWDIGAWVKVAAMLSTRYGTPPYDYAQAADDMAEVLWQDSYNNNPGLFDLVEDAGWDPSYLNNNYWWYSLGITGLIEAFNASNTHTSDIPGLVARIKASQYSTGAVSGSYGANTNDEDWQSTAYAALALANYNQGAYQIEINHMGYFIAATQDASGGFLYSDNSHYPEIAGENASAMYFAQAPVVVLVDDNFTSQTDVDTYNSSHSTSYLFGYDAFQTIQNGINGVEIGGTVNVLPGIYNETVDINKRISLIGAGSGSDGSTNTIIRFTTTLSYPVPSTVYLSASGLSDANPLLLQDIRIEPHHVYGLQVPSGSVSYLKLENVKVIGTNETNDTEAEVGFGVRTDASLTHVAINNCAFDHLTYGWYFFKNGNWGPGGSMASNIVVTNTSFSYNDAKGLYVEKLSDASFSNCVVTNNGLNLLFFNKSWHGGFDINLKGNEVYQNLSFTNMTVTNNGLGVKEGAGIMIKARDDGATYGLYPASLTNVTITGGTYSGNERGIRFGEPTKNNATPTNVVIHGADICNNVKTYSGTDGTAYGDMINYTTAPINAEANWWCSVKYATIFGHVYGQVDFDPWCSDATHTNCTLTNPPMIVWVDDSWVGSTEGQNVGGHIFGYDAFTVIADGLSAVGSGGLVNVLDGSYTENLVITKPITITGEDASSVFLIPALSAPNPAGGSLPSGASNLILVQANNVTISGMTLDGNNPSINSGVIRGGVDIDARNGIITNHNVGVFTNLTVYDMIVKNIYLRGIYASSGGTFNFHHNNIQNVNGEANSIAMFNFGGAGIFANNTVADCNDGISSNHSKGIQFLNNTLSNCGSGIHTDNAGDAGGTADLIQGNTIFDSKTNGYGIFVFAPYLPPIVELNTITNVDVGLTCAGAYVDVTPIFRKNIVNGMNKANSTGIYVTTEVWGYDSGNVSVQFTNNEIYNNIDGGYVVAQGGHTCKLYAYDNSFHDNSTSNITTGTGTMGAGTFAVNMSGNWWGTYDFAVVGTTVVNGRVDYTPWLNTGTDTDSDPSNGFQGNFHSLWVDDDSPQTGTINRIQEAVSMVQGSDIHIAPGTYTGQVVIDGFSSLNLIGSGVSVTTIQATASMPHYFNTGSNNYAILSVENCETVNISNLKVDGLGLGSSNYRFVGIAYLNAGGTVSSCKVQDIRNNPINGTQHGIGIYAYTTASPTRTVNVENTAVAGFQKGGITINGAYTIGNVTGCDIDGYGPASFIAMNGVQIGWGAVGSVINNQIYGCSYTGSGWSSAGVLLYNATANPGSVLVRKNLVEQCQIGINYLEVGGTIDSNTVTATPTGTGLTNYWNIVVDPGQGEKRQPPAQPFDTKSSEYSVASASAQSPASITTLANDNILDGGGGGYGLEADAYSPEALNFTASNNRITNFEYGLVLWEESGATLTSTLSENKMLLNGLGLYNDGGYVDAQNNIFSNSTNAYDVTASNFYNQNCWSDYSGSGSYAIGGGGGNVDNNPNVDCGLNISPDDIFYQCNGTFSYTVQIGDVVKGMEGANIWIEYPAELNVSLVTSASSNYFISYTQTNHLAGEKDTLKVNLGVLVGAQDGPADLFTVTMNGTVSVCSSQQIAMVHADLRDTDNNQIVVSLASPSAFKSDCVDPALIVNSPASGGYFNLAPVLNISASDDCDLDAIYYSIDGCTGWISIVSGLVGPVYGPSLWTLPGFSGLTEGSHCLRFKVTDDNGRGNSDSCSYTWCFTKDTEAPLPPTNFTALPGHNKVHLTWKNSETSDIIGIKILRVPWGNYPNFGTNPGALSAPAFPTNQTIGTTVFDSAASSNSSVSHLDTYSLNNTTRDIYYYTAFAYDAAGNYSVASTTAQDRSTSYWMGDIDSLFFPGKFDGQVYVSDLARLSVCYGTKQGDPGFYDHADYASYPPIHPKGIPKPDDSIQYEDLVIFAINYNAVSPTARVVPLFSNEQVDGPLTIALEGEKSGNETLYHLKLANNSGNVKSFRVVMKFDENTSLSQSTIAPELVNSQVPVFTKILMGQNQVTLDGALMGAGYSIGGSGDLATFKFSSTNGVDPVVTLVQGDIRDLENQPLDPFLKTISPGQLPSQYELSQNYPNPFNPTTTISYQIPVAGQVKIDIFNLLGQQVTSLVNEWKETGTYSVEWKGIDSQGKSVSSGIYFYRFSVNDFTATKKMMLVK
jgi:hypothetical protein